MEFNKIFGAVLLAGLIAMMSGFAARVLVHPHELDEPVFTVAATEGAAPAADQAPTGPAPIAPLLAAADPAAGQTASRACAACHTFDRGGANRVGPNLYDIVNAPFGHIEGFAYSAALADHGGSWDYEALNHFLYDPRAYAPGTKMTFAGVKRDQERANIIAYLRTLSENPAPLPDATAPQPDAAAPQNDAAPEAAPQPEAPAAQPDAPAAQPEGAAPQQQ
ncbi:c-type cytochrome [Azospirillum halopraeferens]|uniref:c-type cytochrome n=1 Tax=Azospirillum halopraeferens TaxID=34010 RepID=UPI001FDF7E5B|nr:cytochrome c family protein [Azospirillum halopraeferens]